MKTLKKILIVILVIIAIPLVLALFIKKEFQSEREIVIDRPVTQVFDYVKHVRNQDNFGIWQLSDPEATLLANGTDGTVGFTYSWDGEKVGKGSQTITEIIEGERVETLLDFGFGKPATSYFLTENIGNDQTKVTWGMAGTTPYPLNIMSLFYDLGDDFEEGLQNLKNILENENNQDERSILLNNYQQTLTNLRKQVANLSPNQLHFKPSPDAWSISQCLEHIILTEEMLFGMIKQNIAKPANPERKDEIQFTDEQILMMVTDRSEKYQAPDMLVARGKYQDVESALLDLEKQRSEIISFINNTSVSDMRNHISDSPSGASDIYQSLVFIAGHTARHTLQIEEIKASVGFPE